MSGNQNQQSWGQGGKKKKKGKGGEGGAKQHNLQTVSSTTLGRDDVKGDEEEVWGEDDAETTAATKAATKDEEEKKEEVGLDAVRPRTEIKQDCLKTTQLETKDDTLDPNTTRTRTENEILNRNATRDTPIPKKPQRPSTRPARPPNFDTSSPIIKLSLDSCAGSVSIHAALLVQDSEYFANYLLNDLPSRKYRYDIQNTSREMFFETSEKLNISVLKAYVQFLYFGTLRTSVEGEGSMLKFLACCYIFGVKVGNKAFRDEVMDAFVTLHVETGEVVLGSFVDLILVETAAGSPMRRFLADMMAHNITEEDGLEDMLRKYPKAFLVDVLVAMARVRPAMGKAWWEHLESEMYCA